LVFHGTAAAAAATAYYRYADRSELFEKSLKGFSDTLSALKRLLSVEIEERLKPVLATSSSVKSLLLDTGGKPYQEAYVSPAGSEALWNTLSSFIQADVGPLCDYKWLIELREKWLFWSRLQNWNCLGALVVEVVTLSVLYLVAKVASMPVEPRYALLTVAPIGLLFASFCTAAVRMSVLHDRFVELRKRHANP
jgi:hypothetical protein